mmetsp:Transcript_21655/g.47202  ORF Transcript_21655/g.47202 Transcript_21655/m.47202 type:complete len:527 (-) Transcript_21655:12-1592(-)
MESLYNIATEFATEHRGIFVTIFVLPISLVFDVLFRIRAWLVFKFYSAPRLHEQRVRQIQAQLKAWKESGANTRLCTSRGGWQSISPSLRTYKTKATGIDINLYDILSLDKNEMYVRCEPMVNMGQLSHFLVPHGLTIPVLPELDDLTVGGLYMGVGIETSSHKYGLFNDTVIEAEVILADGRLVKCSKTENRELFDALPWSYGTLGFVASVKIRVIPSKPFVRVEYIPCTTQSQGVEKFEQLSRSDNPPDFLEALSYSLDEMVIMPANFVDAKDVPPDAINAIGRWYKPWFYKHVESFLKRGKTVEYIPLRDYYHRHTKSIFWELEQIIPWGNNPVFRFFLGWAVPPKVSFLKLTQTESIRKLYETQHVIQDMLVPISKMKVSLDCFHSNFNLYPLWICPYRAYDYSDKDEDHRCFLKKPLNLEKGKNYEMYVDLGAYGIPKSVLEKKPFDIVKVSRTVEAFIQGIRGFQMLYADSYMDRDEFRNMFSHKHYDAMKQKYDPTGAFPQVYEKVCKKGIQTWDKKKN